jgi:hypothetical protein
MMIATNSRASSRTSRFDYSGGLRCIATATLVLSLAACATEDITPFTDEGTGPANTTTSGQVIATAKTSDGATLVFVNENAGDQAPSIGVEIANSTNTPMTDALLEQQPSALELYLAVVPGVTPPRALLRDHELWSAAHGEGSKAPRQLAIAAIDGEALIPYNCADSAAWTAAFMAWAPVLAGQYIATNESGYTTGYVGYAPKFYFDVCRPWDQVAGLIPYFTGVQRRSSSAAAWVTINANTNALNFQQRRWRYFHNTPTCSSFQYRLVVSSGSGLYHRAARWANEWSCQISG